MAFTTIVTTRTTSDESDNCMCPTATTTKVNNNNDDNSVVYHGPPVGKAGRSKVRKVPASTVPNGYACGGPNAQVDWLSLDVVKEALHVPLDAVFFQCDNGNDFEYYETETDLISWCKEIIATNTLRILVYNGDTDPCINSYEAQNWTSNLGLEVLASWRPWTTDSCQRMGGYVTRYENSFDFLTIRGSGHMVPAMKPSTSLEFISRFMTDNNYKPYDATCASPSQSASFMNGNENGNDKSRADLNEEKIEKWLQEAEESFAARKEELQAMLKELQTS